MKKIFKHNGRKPGKSSWRWVRALCSAVALLCLLSCVSCSELYTKEEYTALGDELAALSAELDKLKNDNALLEGELASLVSDGEALQNRIDEFYTENEAAKKEIESLKDDAKAKADELERRKAENEAALDEIDKLKDESEAAKAQIDSLKTENAAAKEEIEKLTEEKEVAKAEIEALREQINTPAPSPEKPIKIYIDQGHNPTSHHNAGASGNGLYEQDITYTVGHLLAELLESDSRFEVALSRPTESTVLGTDNQSSLEARVAGAKEFGADYFISIHANAFDAESAHGTEVLVAKTVGTSYEIAQSVLQELVNATGLRNRGIKLREELHVLKNATMPAILVEMGFITNAQDASLMSEHPELFARGIYEGILAYFSA